MLRRILFWTHLAIGLSAGLLILLMSVTGVMLGFERQTIAWIDGHPRAEIVVGAPALPLDSLLSRANIARDSVVSIAVRRAETEPVLVRVRERGSAAVRLHPQTGERLAANGSKGQAFFSALRRWHRWVGAQGDEWRARLRMASGVANLIFLALVISGIYLWWPRHWTLARWRATAIPSLAGHGRVRDFNWHNAFGFWAAIPLALIIASGAFISFRWPGLWLDRALGSDQEKAAAITAIAEARAERRATGQPSAPAPSVVRTENRERSSNATPTRESSLDSWLVAARASRPEWKLVTLMMPAARDTVVRVTIAEGNTYRPDLRHTLTLSRASGTVARAQGYDELSASRKIRAWVRFGHTGEVFGVPGQIAATLASAVGVLLVWTGFTLAWRRLTTWRARRRRARAASIGAAATPSGASDATRAARGANSASPRTRRPPRERAQRR